MTLKIKHCKPYLIDFCEKILYHKSVLRNGKGVSVMNIGAKIRNARNNAGLTQEQAAEALGVSRQTISNWENEKSYPDIISVVKMSDLYSISLDALLKEDNNMEETYLGYLEESTNVVKSKEKFSKLILILVYIGIWAFSVMFFWLFTAPSDAMAYGLVFQWIIMPVTTFIVALLIGKRNYFGRKKWFAPIIMGVMFMLNGYATFDMANMTAFKVVRWPDFSFGFAGLIIAAAGVGIGELVRRIIEKKKLK